MVPLSNESWSMSFAKYLELRFYGHQYTRRANAEPCGHSIHKDYHQYFSYNQMVASFRYRPGTLSLLLRRAVHAVVVRGHPAGRSRCV